MKKHLPVILLTAVFSLVFCSCDVNNNNGGGIWDDPVETTTESTLPDGFDYMLETAGQPDTIRMCYYLT